MPRVSERSTRSTSLRPAQVEKAVRARGVDMESPFVSGLREDATEQTTHREAQRGEVYGGPPGVEGSAARVLREEADRLLRADASRRGRTLSKYLRDGGMMTEWQEKQIRRWEVPLREDMV